MNVRLAKTFSLQTRGVDACLACRCFAGTAYASCFVELTAHTRRRPAGFSPSSEAMTQTCRNTSRPYLGLCQI